MCSSDLNAPRRASPTAAAPRASWRLGLSGQVDARLLATHQAADVVRVAQDHHQRQEQREGRALLVRLQEWAAQPEYSYRHEWQEGDFVVWDNTGYVLLRRLPAVFGKCVRNDVRPVTPLNFRIL